MLTTRSKCSMRFETAFSKCSSERHGLCQKRAWIAKDDVNRIRAVVDGCCHMAVAFDYKIIINKGCMVYHISVLGYSGIHKLLLSTCAKDEFAEGTDGDGIVIHCTKGYIGVSGTAS